MNKKIYLILPNIRSAHNVGAMFRIADCFGVEKIFLSGYTPTPEGKRKVEKVALGAEKWVEWEQVDDTVQLVEKLKKKDFEIVGLEKTKISMNIEEVGFQEKIALIVGEEVAGMDFDLIEICDQVVHITMHGKKSSLNVSVATGVALHSIIT